MIVREERLASYCAALDEATIHFDSALIIETKTSHAARSALCFNDVIAIGMMRALVATGFMVGKDVIGFDDIEEVRHTLTALASVAVNGRRLGACAAQLLMRQLASGDFEPLTILRLATPVVRALCGPAPATIGAQV